MQPRDDLLLRTIDYPHNGLSGPAPIIAIGFVIHPLLTLLIPFSFGTYKDLIVVAAGVTETTKCCAVLHLPFLCRMV